MIDPRLEAVLVYQKERGVFEDKTAEIDCWRWDSGYVHVRFLGRAKEYRYTQEKVAVLRDPTPVGLAKETRVEIAGALLPSADEVWRFDGPGGAWWRVFFRDENGQEKYRTSLGARLVEDVQLSSGADQVLGHWRDLLSQIDPDDPLQKPYASLTSVHPESALRRYLEGESPLPRQDSTTKIFPFSFNLSQREAVDRALRHSLSVIEGPPGTGKTQTILNLIANIVLVEGQTVGVVSFNNAAVDNVREKLEAEGFGYLVAGLGNREKKAEFFDRQETRNTAVADLVRDKRLVAPPAEQLAELDRRLLSLREAERQLASLRQEAAAYRLERGHFRSLLERREIPELGRLPLLDKSSERILGYLVESHPDGAAHGPARRLILRVTNYLKYGSTRRLDPSDTDVVLRLQDAYYDKRLEELDLEVARLEQLLDGADFTALAAEHERLSGQILRSTLQQRYSTSAPRTYDTRTYRQNFAEFSRDYPVILSTCHSLRGSLPEGRLLDYLIIDEASQVNLLTATLALASCRNLIVVGDLRQLAHIADKAACTAAGPSPSPAYDYEEHSILSSLVTLYGDSVPRTMLREHYRCDPAIIGFCNEKFYDGQLIPFTTATPGSQPLVVVRTVEGNHMRGHRGGGRSNLREVEVIRDEVIPAYCAGLSEDKIGVTTPYRRQVDKLSDALIESIESDTVHKFQGREKEVVVLTTVLDETWRGRVGTRFVDDPRLVNVAVSRATHRFVLVTNNSMLPTSRNLRDLIGYIKYHSPGQEAVDSHTVSVFDLLYRDYSKRLRPLAGRLRGEMKYRSEDIVWTVLMDILAEETYQGLTAKSQMLVTHLIPDSTRLTPEQARYVKNRSSVDFVVYNRVTREPVLAIEVDGFRYHENNPEQLARDALKNAILETYSLPLLRLPTTASGEELRIRRALDAALI